MRARPNQHTPQNFSGLYKRLVALTSDPRSETGCWVCRPAPGQAAYGRINIRIRGQHRKVAAHRAMLTLIDCGDEPELFADLLELYSIAKLECDHLCFATPRCINPDHLQWLTHEEHVEKNRSERHPDQIGPNGRSRPRTTLQPNQQAPLPSLPLSRREAEKVLDTEDASLG